MRLIAAIRNVQPHDILYKYFFLNIKKLNKEKLKINMRHK